MEWIQQKLNQAMELLSRELEVVLREYIQKLVYDAYDPVQYQRTGELLQSVRVLSQGLLNFVLGYDSDYPWTVRQPSARFRDWGSHSLKASGYKTFMNRGSAHPSEDGQYSSVFEAINELAKVGGRDWDEAHQPFWDEFVSDLDKGWIYRLFEQKCTQVGLKLTAR